VGRAEPCPGCGRLRTPACPHRGVWWLIQAGEPAQGCGGRRAGPIERLSGLVAGPNCPPERVERRVFTFWPAEALDWVRAQGLPEPPTAPCPLHPGGQAAAPEAQGLALVSPDPGGVYRLSRALPAEVQALEIGARPVGGVGLAAVTFYVDGAAAGRVAEPPYRIMWPMQAGEHVVWAEAALPNGGTLVSETRRFTVLPPDAPSP